MNLRNLNKNEQCNCLTYTKSKPSNTRPCSCIEMMLKYDKQKLKRESDTRLNSFANLGNMNFGANTATIDSEDVTNMLIQQGGDNCNAYEDKLIDEKCEVCNSSDAGATDNAHNEEFNSNLASCSVSNERCTEENIEEGELSNPDTDDVDDVDVDKTLIDPDEERTSSIINVQTIVVNCGPDPENPTNEKNSKDVLSTTFSTEWGNDAGKI